jgi:hypothetical protein
MERSRQPGSELGESVKEQTWIIAEDLTVNPNVDYINSCCEFGDVVLEKIKNDISEKTGVEVKSFVIGQEDWGWYLEFQKGEIIYLLSISYQDKDSNEAHNFGVIIEAEKLEKGFIFNRKVEASKEADEVAKIIENIARQNNFQVFEA